MNACRLAGDIGGTNARFALVPPDSVQLQQVKSLRCRDYRHPEDAVRDYLGMVGAGPVTAACFAVAGPVSGSHIRVTNSHWQFDTEELCQKLGWQSLRVINDFTAMALGIPHVSRQQMVHVCGGPGDERQPCLVMGPGTGLGVSGLIPSGSGWRALVTEGGHVDFAPVDDTDIAVMQILKARFGLVSVERILSGQGLLNLYQAHARLKGVAAELETPEAITAAALEQGDSLPGLVLNHFCEILGRTAGNAVLTQGSTGGVYLCGGILPRILSFFLDSRFPEGFTDKGRMGSLLEKVPVYVVTDTRTGLLGAANALVQEQSRA